MCQIKVEVKGIIESWIFTCQHQFLGQIGTHSLTQVQKSMFSIRELIKMLSMHWVAEKRIPVTLLKFMYSTTLES